MIDPAAEKVARALHESYERLAPSFGFEPVKASSVPWEQVPEKHRSLMLAVVAELLDEHVIQTPLPVGAVEPQGSL